MSSMELTRVAHEIERLAKFFETIGLHTSLWRPQLAECETAAVQKIIANNRQMVMDFNSSGSAAMAERWDCSRRTAFRKRDKAAKECQIIASA
jgi:hypothetical protein